MPHRYGGSFTEEVVGQRTRLVVYPSGSAASIVRGLAGELASPLFVLWILHTSRTGLELGRYQSPALTVDAAQELLDAFGDFFDHDARSDVWFHSADSQATIVWERHDLIYAYGPVDAFRRVLEAEGLTEGQDRIPSPHAHDYHAEFDGAERALAGRFEWTVSELRPEDEQ